MSLRELLFSALHQHKRLLGMCFPDVRLVSGRFFFFYIFAHLCVCVTLCVFTCVTAHTHWSVRQFFLDGMCR